MLKWSRSHILCNRTNGVEPMHSVSILSSMLFKGMLLDSFDTYDNAIVVLFLRSGVPRSSYCFVFEIRKLTTSLELARPATLLGRFVTR
jgi:hypothetical protein